MPKLGYDHRYEAARRRLLAPGPLCAHCQEAPATEADHQPPLSLHNHARGTSCCVLVPSCSGCARKQAVLLNGIRSTVTPSEPIAAEPDGFPVDSPFWSVEWLDDLREVPDDATWPRLMTVPHPRAVASLGAEAAEWNARRRSSRWRWWQRLAAVRLLEVDEEGSLVWGEALLTVARQVGKTWWLGDVCAWRLEQGDRFGGTQTVISTGKDVAIVREMQRPARTYAKRDRDTYKVREVNGQEEIELLADSSRWMVRARTAVYGFTASLATVDEAWKVPAATVDEGLAPTMVERDDAQLVLTSTAHRQATVLMIGRRASALDDLGDPDPYDTALLIEWSARRDADPGSRDAWRQASPTWTPRRERFIAKRYAAAVSGESDDLDEPDPIEAFRAQWLNIWPEKRTVKLNGTELIDVDLWAERATEVDSDGPLMIGIEDYFGHGAAIAFVGRLDAERWVVGGWTCENRGEAYAFAKQAAEIREGSSLVVGASLAGDPAILTIPVAKVARAGKRELTASLSMFREMLAAGTLQHDDSPDLSEQVAAARVVEGSDGLRFAAGVRTDLVRASVWAVRRAVSGQAIPTIHGPPSLNTVKQSG